MADVFISYGTQDRDRVKPIVDAIEEAGYSVWWDRRIGIGRSFDREIERELDACGCVVVIWSRTSVESDWVRNEAQEGLDRGILVPVLVDDIRAPLAFRRVQGAQFHSGDADALTGLLEAVASVIAERTGEVQVGDEIETAATRSLPIPDTSIAVLPFVNVSSDPEQEYFSDGLSEELLNLLARVPELKVAARTSSFSLKGKDLQIAEVGDILKVAHVLEGSVRKSGNRVRITTQLIHAEDGYHLWSQTYDRTLEDIFAIQDEIAQDVVAQLKIELLGAAPKVEQTDPEAYMLVLQARYLGHLGTQEGWESARALYEQALAINPDYASAWSGLASTYISQANKAQRPLAEGYTLAREAAARALLVDPECSTAHAQLGIIADLYDRDLAAAARHIEHALALDPTDTEIRGFAGRFAMGLGRLDEARALIDYVIARDPVNAPAHRMLALCHYFGGRFDSAITSFRTALRLNSAAIGAYGLLGRAYLLKGEPNEALAIVEQEQSDWTLIELPLVYYALGRISESDAVLAELIEKYDPEAATDIAAVHAYRGELDQAFAWLNRALACNDPGLTEVAPDPVYALLHVDPRWEIFLEQSGRSPAQLSAIEFKLPSLD